MDNGEMLTFIRLDEDIVDGVYHYQQYITTEENYFIGYKVFDEK